MTPSASARESSTELPLHNQACRKVSQSGSEVWSDIDEGLSALQTEVTPTDKRENQQPQSNVQQRVPFKVAKTSRRLSNTTSTESMLMRRHGPRKVPGDVARSKKSVTDEEPHAHSSSTLTTCSETTGISHRPSGSERASNQNIVPLMETKPEIGSQHQEQQQATAEGPETGEWGTPSSPKAPENFGRQSQPYQRGSSAQWFGPRTPESIGRPPLLKADGSAPSPLPQSMRSAYASPESSEPPLARPAMPPSQNSDWTSQQGDDAWGQGPGRPTPIPLRPGVSLFQQPGHQVTHPGLNTRGPLPQSPRSSVRLEDQVEALREHIASRERPLGPKYGNPIQNPGPYWPQMFPTSPQAQRIRFRGDHSQGLRSAAPQTGVPSPAPTAPGLPHLEKITLEGYELLAAKLTDGSIGARPMYRSFEHLHHRLLLYLQDEICEYEEELRNLDEWISQIGLVVSEGKSKPASRRAEARITPADSELMFRRKFVLGEIFVKLERYRKYALVQKVGCLADEQ